MQSVLWTTLHVLGSLLHPFVWTSGPQCRIVKSIHAESTAWTWRAPKEANSCYGNAVAQRSLFGAGQTFELSSNSTTSSILKALKLGWEMWKFLEEIVCPSMNPIKTSSYWLMIPTQVWRSSTLPRPNRIFRNPMKIRTDKNKNDIKQLTSELGAFFQSDNPTDLRHNETPWLHPGLAGDDLAMTPAELGSHRAKKSKRKPWREGNDGNIDISQEFLELLGWVASSTLIAACYSILHVLFQIYLLVI